MLNNQVICKQYCTVWFYMLWTYIYSETSVHPNSLEPGEVNYSEKSTSLKLCINSIKISFLNTSILTTI